MQKKWIALALVTLIACTVMIVWRPSTVEEGDLQGTAPTYINHLYTDITLTTGPVPPDNAEAPSAPDQEANTAQSGEVRKRKAYVHFETEVEQGKAPAEKEASRIHRKDPSNTTYIISSRFLPGPAIASDTDNILFANRSSYRLTWKFEGYEGFNQEPGEEVLLSKDTLSGGWLRTELVYYDADQVAREGLDTSIRVFNYGNLYCSLTVVDDFNREGVRVISYYVTEARRRELLRRESMRWKRSETAGGMNSPALSAK